MPSTVWPLQVPVRDLSHLPLHRFGLYSPSHELMVHMCCAYGAYHALIKFVKSKHDIYVEHCEQLLIEPHQQAWSVFAEAYQADARDFGVSVPHYSLHAFLHWRLNFEDPTAVTAILSPEPVCNHEDFIQEFVPSALEYPASSPAEIELTGDHEYDIALTDN